MSGLVYEVSQNSRGFVVTIYKHNKDVREQVEKIIGRPVKRADFPTGRPVFVPTTKEDE